MKIYYNTDLAPLCPYGNDCSVGDTTCIHCGYNDYTEDDYVECHRSCHEALEDDA